MLEPLAPTNKKHEEEMKTVIATLFLLVPSRSYLLNALEHRYQLTN